ncbi:hypothetical protein DB30_07310 [Enhygromyxa salina]|uniref:Uncharacterized protein n=2 Tax=Enhygromyxa salina TaxID=215803 RepID=A0A0C1ZSK0_9BACT|nr:hypothetical protein DB30_07310 [Enhygromyxa salina]
MEYRRDEHPGQLQRILEVMAETEGGQKVLLGSTPAASGFNQALVEVLGEDEAKQLKAEVKGKVIDPYDGLKGNEKAFKLRMRRRGHYL